jgi:hypothetical protein
VIVEVVRDDDADTVTVTLHGLASTADPYQVAETARDAVSYALTADPQDPPCNL